MKEVSIRAETILLESAAAWPTRPAIVDQSGTYSYSDISNAAHDIHSHLSLAGVTPGSVVGISVGDARSFLSALFGVLLARCVAIPVALNLSGAERQRLIDESDVAWLIHASTLQDTPIELNLPPINSTLQLIPIKPGEESSIQRLFPEAAVMRHTSGTTARSKGVVLSHHAVCERADTSRKLIEVTHDDVVLAPLPLSYHFIASALSCVQAGATVLDCASLTAPEMLRFGIERGATIIYGSPIQYELLIRSGEAEKIPTLRRAISTSALLPAKTAEAFLERFGVRLTQVYGIIEVGLPLWNSFESINHSALGVCRAPYECRVVDELGEQVATGEVGELAIRGPGLFAGYFFGNEAGAPHRRDQWFHTGDLVVQDELGVILYKGRKKSVINCGGNKIFPEEVEEILQRAPEIEAVRVSAEPHPLLGSLVVAEVVVSAEAKPAIELWRSMCYSELSGYKVPKEFRIVDSLPTTGSGKIVRHSNNERV